MQLVKALTADELARLTRAPVLKAADYARDIAAHKLLHAARAEARNIVAEARAQRAEIFAAARREAQAEMQKLTAARARALSDQLEVWVDAVKPQLMQAVFAAVRKLVRSEPPLKRVESALKQALSDVASLRTLTLRLHPADLRAFAKARAALRRDSKFRGEILLKPDAQLEPGDCVVETSLGVLDLRLETQLQTLKTDLASAP